MTSWGADGTSFRIYAIAGAEVDDPTLLGPYTVSGDDLAQLQRGAYVVHDVDAEVSRDTIRWRIFKHFGVKSALRVLLPLGSQVFGSLFFSRAGPQRFSLAAGVSGGGCRPPQRAGGPPRAGAGAGAGTRGRARGGGAWTRGSPPTREARIDKGEPAGGWALGGGEREPCQGRGGAPPKGAVLLPGGEGTGKEVVARFIHHASRRSSGPFVAINCAALPDQLLESELFGHERGAFTGAVAAKPGRSSRPAAACCSSTKIGEMVPTVQAKLLRVLEEREFMRVGGTRVDARHASSPPPTAICTPRCSAASSARISTTGWACSRSRCRRCASASRTSSCWPTPSSSRSARPSASRRPASPRSAKSSCSATRGPATCASPGGGGLPPGGVNLEAIERSFVIKALHQARHNKTRAAKLLGLTRAQLYSRIEKCGLAEIES